MIVFTLPIHLRSVANLREHWRVKAKHAKAERYVAKLGAGAVLPRKIAFPVRVTITRISPRALDVDNAWASAKHVIDGLADALGLPNDRDPRVEWCVKQAKGKPSAVRVEIAEARDANS